jgi:hypothetical protein
MIKIVISFQFDGVYEGEDFFAKTASGSDMQQRALYKTWPPWMMQHK